jgi:hypothetical protein
MLHSYLKLLTEGVSNFAQTEVGHGLVSGKKFLGTLATTAWSQSLGTGNRLAPSPLGPLAVVRRD